MVVYPKGLAADLDYDVRFDVDSRVQNRKGAELMQRGIRIPELQPGEIVYLNLPKSPGRGTDQTPPTVPTKVTQRVATNVFSQGVEVSWQAARDDNWLSCYDIVCIDPNGAQVDLGKVAQRTFYFDRTKPAAELDRSRYEVRAVDGDGNTSAYVAAKRIPGEPETYHGFAGYGAEQGFRGWNYRLSRDGGKTFRAGPLYWDKTEGYGGRWTGMQDSGMLTRTYMQPHPTDDLARVFTVPRGGTVRLCGCVKKDLPPGLLPSDQCACAS